MHVSSRINNALLVAALAICGAAFVGGSESAQASAAAGDVCADRYGCPGGPDKCLTLGYPDGSSLTCYKTAGVGTEEPVPDQPGGPLILAD